MDEHTVEYERPDVVDYGDLVELTAGNSDGESLDQTFQVGTLKSNLTFSD